VYSTSLLDNTQGDQLSGVPEVNNIRLMTQAATKFEDFYGSLLSKLNNASNIKIIDEDLFSSLIDTFFVCAEKENVKIHSKIQNDEQFQLQLTQ